VQPALVATYLPHLLKSLLVDTELVKVVHRRRNYLVDDGLVNGTLLSLSAGCLDKDPIRMCRSGVLTTTTFDMLTVPGWYINLEYGIIVVSGRLVRCRRFAKLSQR